MRNKKNFLVTGGTGFIGSNICKLLIELGHNVTIFDNNSRGEFKRIKEFNKKVKFIKGDIRDQKKFFKSLKNINSIIHLAYINGTKYFYEKPELILDVAIKGLVNIFDGCKKFKIKELYLASSSEVYQTPLKVPTSEEEPLKIPDINNPRFSYGGGKILTELMGINYGRKFFTKIIIFRPHNVYGSNMGNEHVIPELIRKMGKIKKNSSLKIQGTGKEIRSFIYIKDFISGFHKLLTKGKHLQIYNIGTTQSIKIKDLVLKISKIMKKKIIIKSSALKKGSTKIRKPNIAKIRKLGFKPKYTLDQGLKEIIFNKK
tara:strand:+ start:8 stop:952 length:945 start_codon:yes stop_codon:yes gene_type:complete